MKRAMFLSVTLALGILPAHDEVQGKPVTVTGTVIDTGCYFAHNGKGVDHVACATMCARNGIPLAIVDDAGKLYLPIAVEHKNQNARLISFIEKKVKVNGVLLEKGGMAGIAIKTVVKAP